MKFTQILALAFAALTLSGLVASEGTQALRSGKFFKSQDKKRKKSKSSCSKESRSSKSCSKDSCDRKSIESISTDSCPKRGETLRIGIFDTRAGNFDKVPLTFLDFTAKTASGFDPAIWCELARCVNRDVEFLAFNAPDYHTNLSSALSALINNNIDVIGTTVSEADWRGFQNTSPNLQTNFLIGLDCEFLLPRKNIIWDDTFLPGISADLKNPPDRALIKLWQIDDLVFGTQSEQSPEYNDLRLAALSAGRSEDYFKSHLITDTAAYSQDPIQYLAHFGPIGSSDKYQALYLGRYNSIPMGESLQRLQVCPWAKSNQTVDVSRSTINFIGVTEIPPMTDDSFGYLLRKDCCQLIRDLQECVNALICDGTYNQICENLKEVYPLGFVPCLCTPPLYASFAEGTVSRHCICCTRPHKPCVRRHPCALPCTPTFSIFTPPAPAA